MIRSTSLNRSYNIILCLFVCLFLCLVLQFLNENSSFMFHIFFYRF